MIRIDIATLFPEMCSTVFSTSITGRGISSGAVEIYAHNIRDYTADPHRNVDDKPYGGGTGMVMQAQPIYDCVKAIEKLHKSAPRVIYLTPQGEPLTQAKVSELAEEDGLILICGHYEGVDERVLEELEVEEISIGDFVVTGGELPALILTDAVSRLQDGVLPSEDAYSIESHYNGLLEYPQYSRPEVWRDRAVPGILLTGDHAKVSEWQLAQSLAVTKKKRPDLYDAYISGRLEGFKMRFLADHPDAVFAAEPVFRADKETLRLILRGRLRELPDAGYKRTDNVIITNELDLPRCIVQIAGIRGDKALIQVRYKEKAE